MQEPRGPFLLTGASFLFTWNVRALSDPDAEWRRFLQWREGQATGRFKGIRFSATMEESLHSDDAERVHIHEQRELCVRLNRASLDPFVYTTQGGVSVRPNCAPNYLEAIGSSSTDGASRGRGAAYRAACDRAHYSSEYIMRWRHVLMGPPEPVTLGQSSTGMYTYEVFLGRKAVICSMDDGRARNGLKPIAERAGMKRALCMPMLLDLSLLSCQTQTMRFGKVQPLQC